MAAEIQIVSTLDNDQTIQGFVETEQAASKTADSINEAGASTLSFQQKLRQLKKEQDGLTLDERIARVKDTFDNAAPSVDKLTAEIKEYQGIALAAGRESPVGREFLEKAAQAKDQLVDLQNETKRLSDDNRNLKAAIQGIGVGVSAFAGVTAAAVAFGGENEELRQALVKVTAAQTLLNSVQQIQVALQKESSLRLAINNGLLKAQALGTGLLSTATAVYNTVVGKSTGALKGFRIALATTGIGAIVVGIGLLIANFDSIASAVGGFVEELGGLKETLLSLVAPIIFITSLFSGVTEEQMRLAEEEQKAAEQRKEATAEFSKQNQQRLKEIDQLREAEADAFKDKQSALDLEIDRLEATGQASFTIKLQKLQDIVDEEKAILDSNQRKVDSWIQYYTNLAALNGQSEEEFKATLKAQGVDTEDLLNRVNELQEKQRDKIFAAETEVLRLQTENNKKRSADAKKTADEIAKIEDDLLKRRIAAIESLDQLEREAIVDAQERQEAALIFRFEQRTSKLSADIEEEAQLIKALEIKLQNDLLKIQADFFEKERQASFDQQQELDDLRIQLIEERRVSEEEQFAVDTEISNLRFQEEQENLRFQLESKELTEEEFRLRQQLLEEQHEKRIKRHSKRRR